jgi:ectoine hydroxylase-related dioxygenase (phytanoyl-CoA dioxygenase family)
MGFISRPSMLTWNSVLIEPVEDDIVVFPSKTLHATAPNQSERPRISISADVTTMLRDSRGHETMMPHFSHWRSFDAY